MQLQKSLESAENPTMAINEYTGELPETAAYVQELMLRQMSKAVVVIAKMDGGGIILG
ncbi:MAG: hypothetical protein ACE5KT_05815 [Methanosarcinales archaeon]